MLPQSLYLMDGAAAGIWLLLNIALIRILVRLHDRLFSNQDFVSRGLFSSVMFVAMLILAGTICGAFGVLTAFRQQLLCVMLLKLLDWRISKSAGTMFAGTLVAETSAAGSRELSLPAESSSWWCGLRWAPICLLVSHSVLNGVLKFPSDFDSLWYHMPLINYWLQAGSLFVPDCARWYFPANSELIGVWATAGCSGDFFVPLNNVPVVIMWGFATRSIFETFGLRSVSAGIGTASVLGVYTTIHETVDASNDLLVVAAFSSALAWTLRFIRVPIRSEALRDVLTGLIGISTGLLAGTKHFALGYALGAFVLFAGSLLFIHHGRSAAKRLALCAGLAVPFGGYWYLRNWWVTGLLLYPIGAGEAVGENTYPDLWSTSIMGNGHPEMLSMVLNAIWEKCGPIHWACVSLLPAIVLGMIVLGMIVVSRRASNSLAEVDADAYEPQSYLLIGLAMIGCLLTWLVTPFCVEDEPGSLNHLQWAYTPIRYGLCFLSVSVMAGVLLIDRLYRFRLRALFGENAGGSSTMLLGAVASWQWIQLIVKHLDQVQPALLAMLAVDLLIVFSLVSRVRNRTCIWCLRLSIIVIAVSWGTWASADWHTGLAGHFQRYTGLARFDTLVQSEEPASFLVYDQRAYLWFGSARQNLVIQPSQFRSLDETQSLIGQRNPQFVVTRRRPEYSVFVYEQAWSQIPKLSGCALLQQTGDLRVYSLQNLDER